MVEKNNVDAGTSDREIVFKRVFNAPRELVFQAWTEPKQVVNWWGPNGFTTTIHEMNVQPGGIWRLIMHGPDGVDYPDKVVYEEVVKPERLVLRHFGGKNEDSVLFLMTVTFVEKNNMTEIIMHMLFPSAAELNKVVKEYGAIEGAKQNLDRLDKYLTNMTSQKELIITRIFDAPRELVWKAWTDPIQFMRWWGPKDFTSPFCKIDFRVGGKFLFCMRSAIKEFQYGKDFWNTGVYKEIVPLELIVFTNSFSDEKGNVVPATYYDMSPDFPLEMLVTVSFEEHDGKTKMILKHTGIPSGQMTDLTGQGWNQSLDKLADSLK